ncbi:hypothetical protein ABH991_006047 [Bradyrhizobium ottawaense]|uniref:Uncharacterized protein n=1 Tax=Bradyrhizobium ottawaense TaxID=931866 RepID=A0ABV4FZ16_9BRAD
MPEGHPAGLAVAAGPVLAEAMQKGPSQPAAALEFQVQMVGSIAQTKRTRKSARPIALELVLRFPAQPNPARKIFSAHEGDLWAAVRPSQAGPCAPTGQTRGRRHIWPAERPPRRLDQEACHEYPHSSGESCGPSSRASRSACRPARRTREAQRPGRSRRESSTQAVQGGQSPMPELRPRAVVPASHRRSSCPCWSVAINRGVTSVPKRMDDRKGACGWFAKANRPTSLSWLFGYRASGRGGALEPQG